MDALILSRMQFGFTVAFHIIFPAFTIGLASYLAVLEGLWLLTKRDVFKNLYLFWLKVFALAFGMGVVSGVVMSYQFGTNWSGFIAAGGNVLGPLLAYEVLTAFFLEASFLGIMLYGWKRVGKRLHFFATCSVAFGTALSAFWILSANSWMQTPAGFSLGQDGRLVADNYLAVIFNPSFPSRMAHMLLAAYVTTGMAVAGASAWRLLRGQGGPESRMALRMAVLLLAVLMPLQILAGHQSGIVTQRYQPAKLAAMEGWWEAEAPNRGTSLIGLPDAQAEKNLFELDVPNTSGWLFEKGAKLQGLKAFAAKDRPPVAVVYWAFRIMVGMGMVMLAIGLYGAWLWARGRLDANRWFLRAAVLASPAGFVAVLAGWVTTEVGRQPWIVQGVLRTADALSPVSAGQVAISLLVFLIVYSIVFCAGALYILRLVGQGAEETPAQQPAPISPFSAGPARLDSPA